MATFLLNEVTSPIFQRGGVQGVWRRLAVLFVFASCFAEAILAQKPAPKVLTWPQARDEFEMSNPTLRAARLGIDESRDEEITAFLRPNPDLAVLLDQINPFTKNPIDKYSPLSEALPFVSGSYLHERQHKRELRLESAKKGTAIAQSQLADQERNLLFNLRERLCARSAGQGRARTGEGEPGLLRS